MNIRIRLDEARNGTSRPALPVLSFPAVQKLGITVEEMVKSAQLQSDAMALIARETPTIAAVSPMDLSVEAEAFGAHVRFSRNEVPAITGQLVEDMEAVEELPIPAPDAKRCALYAEAVRLAKEKIPDKPVLAGMIGPFSLAGRLMDVGEIMCVCIEEPVTAQALLEKVTTFLLAYGAKLREAGADGIVLAEPLAGIISPKMMQTFSKPYVKRLIETLQDENFGIIYHNCGNAVTHMLKDIFEQGALAYHFGNAVDMAQVLLAAPKNAICLGNIDPAGEFANGTPASIRAATKALLEKCGDDRRFIISSGCDIPGQSKWENIEAFFDAVGEYR